MADNGYQSEAAALGVGLALGAGALFAIVELAPVLIAGCGIYLITKNIVRDKDKDAKMDT